MIKLQYLDKHIETELLKENEAREVNHKSSGKLSAGRLGDPLQHQILHAIGVPRDPLEEYVIRKFRRGNHVEDWLRSRTPGLVDEEKFVEYKNVVGYIDALVDMSKWELEKFGTIPHEIKSVTNASFKWIKRDGVKRGHALQACLYALALGVDHFAIHYVASDDYRVETFLEDVSDWEKEVHQIIADYNAQRASGVVPVFEAKEKWQENKKYCNYSRFMDLTEEEIEELLKAEYPQSYKKLKEVQLTNGR
jgi:hypothetical protein